MAFFPNFSFFPKKQPKINARTMCSVPIKHKIELKMINTMLLIVFICFEILFFRLARSFHSHYRIRKKMIKFIIQSVDIDKMNKFHNAIYHQLIFELPNMGMIKLQLTLQTLQLIHTQYWLLTHATHCRLSQSDFCCCCFSSARLCCVRIVVVIILAIYYRISRSLSKRKLQLANAYYRLDKSRNRAINDR